MSKPKSNILGPELGYLDILNYQTSQHIAKQRAENKDKNKTPLRPSAAGKCTRELAYELQEFHGIAKYETELITPETQRLFSLGHSIEWHAINQIEQHMKEYFEVRYKQQSLSFAYLKAVNNPKLSQWLEGSLDLVLWSEKHKCVADWKSKKIKYSSYRDSDWTEFSEKLGRLKSVEAISEIAFWVDDLEAFIDEINDPFLAMNFYQLNLYALNPFLVERGVDHAAIFQYSKIDSKLREIRFRPSQKLYDYVILKMQTALDAVDHNDIERAPRDFQLGSIKCAFCAYKKICWPEDDPLKAYFKTFPPKSWPKDTDTQGRKTSALENMTSCPNIRRIEIRAAEPLRWQKRLKC